MQTFCTTKQCNQNRGSAGEDLWSQQCGNPGYQAKKKHVEMTSKWRASFTFHRSLDCSCRLLCWASSSAPSAANKIHTTTLRDNCNTTCSFFFLCFYSSFLWPYYFLYFSMFVLRKLFSFSPSSSPSKLVLSPPSFLRYLLPLFVLFLALEYEEFQHFWRFRLLLLFRKKQVVS